MRDPRVHATVVGFTKPGRISTLMASAAVEPPPDLWIELETLVPPRSCWLDFQAKA
jgi:D-threo-aldose 1-dehydrogenase